MGLFEHWPYTNFHDLNLNWIIKKIKNVETAEQNTAASAADAARSAEASQASADASQASAEASQASAEASQASAEASAGSAAEAESYVDHIADPVSGIVTTWLEENITPTTPAVDASLSIAGAAADAAVTGRNISFLTDSIFNVKLAEQSDLLEANTNFVIDNGSAYAISNTTPYNWITFPVKHLTFKFRRRATTYNWFLGVYIDDFFAGVNFGNQVTEVSKIKQFPQGNYTDAAVNYSIADNVFSQTDYSNYTVSVENNVFTLRRDNTMLLQFTVNESSVIKGIAILNYGLTYANDDPTDTDLKEIKIYESVLNTDLTEILQHLEYADMTGTGKKYRIIGGAVRNSGSGWYFIVDNDHQADLNCVSVTTDSSGNLIINYPDINASKIVSFIITPDETYSEYHVGASVGKTYAICQIYKHEPSAVSGIITYDSNTGTFEVSANAVGITSAEWNNNRMIITHDVTNNNNPLISITPFRFGSAVAAIPTWTSTTTEILFKDIATGNNITQPSNKCEILFTRAEVMRYPYKKIDASTLTNASGNFWFFGIFEVD